jgi:hypothetical protein
MLIDYSHKIVPLMILKILGKEKKPLCVREIANIMSTFFFGEKKPERRSILLSIQMLKDTDFPIEHIKKGQTRFFFMKNNIQE